MLNKTKSKIKEILAEDKELKKAYKKLKETAIFEEIFLCFFDHLWVVTQNAEREQTAQQAIFSIRKEMLDLKNNTYKIKEFLP